jgi:hypothetical protein
MMMTKDRSVSGPVLEIMTLNLPSAYSSLSDDSSAASLHGRGEGFAPNEGGRPHRTNFPSPRARVDRVNLNAIRTVKWNFVIECGFTRIRKTN